ncbi:MAG: tyrosine-type recombinase/integrase [Anaerolineae bacterium]|nr:tyrosine-type recombinase/integrase [Anaerolineae bacterium]
MNEQSFFDEGWEDWVEVYRTWLDSKGGGNTVKTYEIACRQFFDFAKCKPWEVTPKLAKQWRIHLTKVEQMSESTVNLKISALASFYVFAQREHNVFPTEAENPFWAVKRNKVTSYSQAKYPSEEEAKAMLGVINRGCLQGKRDFALIFTFLITCRKASEILNLKWGDLESTAGDDYSFRFEGGLKRAVLPAACYAAITAYLEASGRLDSMRDEDVIFTALDPERAMRLSHIDQVDPNQPLSNAMANKILKKYARRAGVSPQKAHLHGLRHAGARLRAQLMKKGVDLKEMCNLLGHSSMAVTKIYTMNVLTDPEDKGAAAAVDALFPGK